MAFWIFKLNPKLYDLTERLADSNATTTYKVTRYRKEITLGDTIFIMETGGRRSIRAVMRVEEGPRQMLELESEQRLYLCQRDTEVRWRVVCLLTHRKVNLPVEDLKSVEGLEGLSIFHGWKQGTNFRVTESEGRLLLSLVERIVTDTEQSGAASVSLSRGAIPQGNPNRGP